MFQNVHDGECQFVFEMKEEYKGFSVNITIFRYRYWEVGIYLKYSTSHQMCGKKWKFLKESAIESVFFFK